MSFHALRWVAGLGAITPTHKLVLFQLAAFHNGRTGQCNPSPERVAAATGLTALQVRRTIRDLEAHGFLERRPSGFSFPQLNRAPGAALPSDWWPSEAAISELLDSYPRHDFSIQEAVDDFQRYCRERGLAPLNPDHAFVRSISALLDQRPPGKVAFGDRARGDEPASVGALLSGRRSA